MAAYRLVQALYPKPMVAAVAWAYGRSQDRLLTYREDRLIARSDAHGEPPRTVHMRAAPYGSLPRDIEIPDAPRPRIRLASGSGLSIGAEDKRVTPLSAEAMAGAGDL